MIHGRHCCHLPFCVLPRYSKRKSKMAGLTGVSWIILIFHTMWFTVLFNEMRKFWGMRKKLKIHARSPMLAMLSGIGSSYIQMVVMFFELFSAEGIALPCWIMLYSNAFFMAIYPLPYLARGLRVVIISDKAWRAKYSTVLSRKNVFMTLSIAFVFLMAFSVLIQFVSSDTYGPNPTRYCFAIADWWFYGPYVFIIAGFSSRIFMELARVQDRINMSKEIINTAISWVITATPFYTVMIMSDFGLVSAPKPLNYLVTLGVGLTQLSTFILEPRRSHGKLSCIPGRKKKKVAIIVDEPQISKWKEKWSNSRIIMAFPPLDQAFEKHVQDYLCSESYDFLKEVDVYIAAAANVEIEAQFARFREIVNMYILPGSELEVNIETSMRNKILKIGDRDHFTVAEHDLRRDIFNPSGTEIRKMLDENLLKTFLLSPVFLNTCKKLEEEQEASASSQLAADLIIPFDEPFSSSRVSTPLNAVEIENSERVISLARASLKFD